MRKTMDFRCQMRFFSLPITFFHARLKSCIYLYGETFTRAPSHSGTELYVSLLTPKWHSSDITNFKSLIAHQLLGNEETQAWRSMYGVFLDGRRRGAVMPSPP